MRRTGCLALLAVCLVCTAADKRAESVIERGGITKADVDALDIEFGNDAQAMPPLLLRSLPFDAKLSCEDTELCPHIGLLVMYPEEFVDAATIASDAPDDADMQEYVRGLFLSMDTGSDIEGNPTGGTGDGTLTLEEVSNRVYAVHRTWMDATEAEWLDERDKDKDGLLTHAELDAAKGDDTSPTRFEYADRNHDGFLTDEEATHFLFPLWFDKTMHPWCAAAYAFELDTDGDGRITESEYIAQPGDKDTLSLETKVPRYLLAHEFRRLDVDNSGFLELPRELGRMPHERVVTIVTHDTHAVMHALDSDGDDGIDADELVLKPGLLVTERDIAELVPTVEGDPDPHKDPYMDVYDDSYYHEDL